MSYVDGYVLPVPKEKIDIYRKMARKAGNIWIEHDALEYRECAGDDLHIEGVLSFTKPFKAKENDCPPPKPFDTLGVRRAGPQGDRLD